MMNQAQRKFKKRSQKENKHSFFWALDKMRKGQIVSYKRSSGKNNNFYAFWFRLNFSSLRIECSPPVKGAEWHEYRPEEDFFMLPNNLMWYIVCDQVDLHPTLVFVKAIERQMKFNGTIDQINESIKETLNRSGASFEILLKEKKQ